MLRLPPLRAPTTLQLAVPKSKHTVTRTRVRRAGQRALRARKTLVRYRICGSCGSPVRPHYVCFRCKKFT